MSRKTGKRSQPADGDTGPWLEPAQAQPGLLLFGPARPPPTFGDDLAAALALGVVAAVVLDPAGIAASERERLLCEARDLCTRTGIAFLLADDAALAINAGAHGAHLSRPESVAAARQVLGAERLIGVGIGLSHHDAMVAGEDGADYVLAGSIGGDEAPDELAEFARWWSDLFVLPCAIACRDGALATLLLDAGADFLAVGGALWDKPGSMQDKLAPLVTALRSKATSAI